MEIAHIAIWVNDIDTMKQFFCHNFGAVSNEKYRNEKKGFESYFLSFGGECRLELMHMAGHGEAAFPDNSRGYAHIALSLGSARAVDELTAKLANSGIKVTSAPRRTGDGYYESCVQDPEGNLIELTE